jgi:hypothetical protein
VVAVVNNRGSATAWFYLFSTVVSWTPLWAPLPKVGVFVNTWSYLTINPIRKQTALVWITPVIAFKHEINRSKNTPQVTTSMFHQHRIFHVRDFGVFSAVLFGVQHDRPEGCTPCESFRFFPGFFHSVLAAAAGVAAVYQ